MENRSEHKIDESILVKMLCGGFTDAEKRTFEKWIDETPGNRAYFIEMKKIWEHSGNLAVFESIDANRDWAVVKQRMDDARINGMERNAVKRYTLQFLRIAAILILLLGVGFLTKRYLFPSPDMILAATGEMKEEILLSDGSAVLLNMHSELIYPEKFNRKERVVSLRGEGYFEITSDPGKVFRIRIGHDAIVEVLGTSFNIKSDQEANAVDVQVVSGRVAFFPADGKSEKIILGKEERAFLQNGSITRSHDENKNFLSWKTGILYFEDERIENVVPELERYYKKVFILENPGNEEILFTSTFDNQSLESVLEEMQLVLNLDITHSDGKIIISVHD